MAFDFEFTRESAIRWRDRATALLRDVRAWQAAFRDGARDPAEVEQLYGDAYSAAFRAMALPLRPYLPYYDWRAFAKAEPAIADALIPFADAMQDAGLDEAWREWDGEPFPWEAEVERTLAELTLALGEDGGAGRRGPALELGEHHTEGAKVRGVAWHMPLSRQQFDILRIPLAAFPHPVPMGRLNVDISTGSRIIRQLFDKDPAYWGRAIWLPPENDRKSGCRILPTAS